MDDADLAMEGRVESVCGYFCRQILTGTGISMKTVFTEKLRYSRLLIDFTRNSVFIHHVIKNTPVVRYKRSFLARCRLCLCSTPGSVCLCLPLSEDSDRSCTRDAALKGAASEIPR